MIAPGAKGAWRAAGENIEIIWRLPLEPFRKRCSVDTEVLSRERELIPAVGVTIEAWMIGARPTVEAEGSLVINDAQGLAWSTMRRRIGALVAQDRHYGE